MSKKDQHIKQRVPFGFPNVSPYQKATEREIKKIEQLLKKTAVQLKTKGVDNDRILQYLFSIVESHVIGSLNELEFAHIEHRERIRETFLRRSSDSFEIQEQINQISIQIAETEEELKIIEKIYKDNNPLYAGRLKLDGYRTGFEEEQEDTDDEKISGS